MPNSKHAMSELLSLLACQALQEELDTTPKYGLVDKRNDGAHTDMSYYHFAASIAALQPYFAQMAELNQPLPDAAASLRQLGLLAEGAMYKATGGVNTHKGAIFALGLAVYACSRLVSSQPTPCKLDSLLDLIASTAAALPSPQTAGSIMCQRYAIPSAYNYAVSGYVQLKEGLQVMKSNESLGKNIANLKVLLYYSSCLHDSCVYKRGGKAAAAWLMRNAGKLYGDFSMSKAEKFDDKCIARGISAGGAADMLSLTLLVSKLIDSNLICLNGSKE